MSPIWVENSLWEFLACTVEVYLLLWKSKKKTWTLEILILWFISVQIKRSKKTKLQWVMIISLWFYVTSEWLLLTIGGKMSKWNGGVYDFWIRTFDFWFNFDLINSFARFLAGIPQQRLANNCDLTVILLFACNWLQRQILAIAWIFNCFHPSTSNILPWPFY